MDIIKFNNPNHQTKMEDGQFIEGLSTKMWVERYNKEGEFKFTAPASIDMRSKLPIGSFISHVDSDELMVVEDHEINESSGSGDLTITGRGLETFFENRIVGSNKIFPYVGEITDYVLESDYPWSQAATLIKNHILVSELEDSHYALPYFTVLSTVTGIEPELDIPRSVKLGDLYKAVLDFLKINNLGIKVVRPGPYSPISDGNSAIVIHNGLDKTNDVMISASTGEIVSADYLWSSRKYRNAALISGKWVQTVVEPDTAVEYDRRMMFVDGQNVDKDFTVAPEGTDLDNVIAAMQQLGREAIAAQNHVVLTKAETSKTGLKALYRRDYGIGDLITVVGDYNETAIMRVSEYVEIEDQNGESGYPTLSVEEII